MSFLPVCRDDILSRGWAALDFIIITGDAYVDHPSFGTALISRLLESEGYRVGIIAQPDWTNPKDFAVLGKPELAFLVTAGNVDSMVNRYTASKKKRSEDTYSPGGIGGRRPDRASIVYTSVIKGLFKNCAVILGGIEASLRRLSHYDYWSDKVRRSILADSKADMIIYGMAEKAMLETARKLKSGEKISALQNIPGTVVKYMSLPENALELPAFSQVSSSKEAFLESFRIQYHNTDPFHAETLAEKTGDFYIIQNPPAKPLSSEEMDRVYSLPYSRQWHPMYDPIGVPALEEVKFSIIHNRGCFGGCSFCALTFHQGRIISVRSDESVLTEAGQISRLADFKGYIHDVGGPTANFSHPACSGQLKKGACPDRQCLTPEPCPALDAGHERYTELLKKIRRLPGIKKVFIRSGLRYDYILAGDNECFLTELISHHISGQLKIAPEHASREVLHLMGKPSIEKYMEFKKIFEDENRRLGKKQYLLPYMIASHPGSTVKDAVETAMFLKENRFIPDQVQDFYPTPGTVSTAMYYTGRDPFSGKEIHIPRGERERKIQRALLQFNRKENRKFVEEGLKTAGRTDLLYFLTGREISPYQSRKGRIPQAKHHHGTKRSR